MPYKKTKTRLLLEGCDSQETARAKSLLGSLDGQLTSPDLLGTNHRNRLRVSSAESLAAEKYIQLYRTIVQSIFPLVGSAGVSLQVFATLRTRSDQLLANGTDMYSWIPNAYIAYPCTYEGLRAAELSVERGIRVHVAFCFSQEQAAGVYSATQTSETPVYVSASVGPLDDCGVDGIDLIRNIQRMYEEGDGHVSVVVSGIRTVDQLLACFALDVDFAAVSAALLEVWASKGFPMPDPRFPYRGVSRNGTALRALPYRNLSLHRPWHALNLRHQLTKRKVEQFVLGGEHARRLPLLGDHGEEHGWLQGLGHTDR